MSLFDRSLKSQNQRTLNKRMRFNSRANFYFSSSQFPGYTVYFKVSKTVLSLNFMANGRKQIGWVIINHANAARWNSCYVTWSFDNKCVPSQVGKTCFFLKSKTFISTTSVQWNYSIGVTQLLSFDLRVSAVLWGLFLFVTHSFLPTDVC